PVRGAAWRRDARHPRDGERAAGEGSSDRSRPRDDRARPAEDSGLHRQVLGHVRGPVEPTLRQRPRAHVDDREKTSAEGTLASPDGTHPRRAVESRRCLHRPQHRLRPWPFEIVMQQRKFLLLLVFASLGTTVLAQRQHAQQTIARGARHATWPPPVQKVGPTSPALSGAAEMKTFFLPAGYHVELVAEDPLVQDPIAIEYEGDGRLWVLERTGFANEKSMADSHEPIGRVVVLEDTNDDGKMDKRTVFIDGLVLPRALKVLTNGVLIGEPPNLWL